MDNSSSYCQAGDFMRYRAQLDQKRAEYDALLTPCPVLGPAIVTLYMSQGGMCEAAQNVAPIPRSNLRIKLDCVNWALVHSVIVPT